MFYTKNNVSDNVEIKVDLYEDEIYTKCPKCGKEIQVDAEILSEIIKEQGLASTKVYCKKCSKKIYEKNQKMRHDHEIERR